MTDRPPIDRLIEQIDRLAPEQFRANPDWAKLPLFDRTGWRRVRFGDVVANLNETVSDPADAGIERFIGLEHLEPGSLHVRAWGNVADGTTFTRRCRPGQVLFGKRRAYQRKVAVAEFDAVVSGDIYVMQSRDDRTLLPELLPFICLSERFFEHAVGTSAGSLSPRTNWSSLASFEFDLPLMEQQQGIEQTLRTINAAGETWLLAAAATSVASQCYATHAFSGFPISGDNATRPVARLGTLFDVTTGGTPARNVAEYWNGSIPWIKTGEVKYDDICATEESITAIALQQSAAKLVEPNSVLIALYGQGPTLGRVAHLRIVAATNQACAAILPNGEYEMRYLYHYLSANYEQIRLLARGASQPNINLAIVRNLMVPVVSYDEQAEVAEVLDRQKAGEKHCQGTAQAMRHAALEIANAMLLSL